MAGEVVQAEGEDRQEERVQSGSGAPPTGSESCGCSCSIGVPTGKKPEKVVQTVDRATSPVRFVPVLPVDQSTPRKGWQDRGILSPIRSQRGKPNDLEADQSPGAGLEEARAPGNRGEGPSGQPSGEHVNLDIIVTEEVASQVASPRLDTSVQDESHMGEHLLPVADARPSCSGTNSESLISFLSPLQDEVKGARERIAESRRNSRARLIAARREYHLQFPGNRSIIEEPAVRAAEGVQLGMHTRSRGSVPEEANVQEGTLEYRLRKGKG